MPATKKATASKASSKKATSAKSVKSPAKKSIFHKIFKSQKGLIKQKALSKSQFLLTAAILGTIGIVGVVASHAGRLEDIAAPTASEYNCATFTDLHKYSKGPCVSYAQALLNYNNHYQTKGSISVDGDFGSKTKAAVEAFQRSHDLRVDGEIGSQTWTALRRVSTQALTKAQVAKAAKVSAQAGVKPRVATPPTKTSRPVAPAVIPNPTVSMTAHKNTYLDTETHRNATNYCLKWSTNLQSSQISKFVLSDTPFFGTAKVVGTYSASQRSLCFDTNPKKYYTVQIVSKNDKSATSKPVNLY